MKITVQYGKDTGVNPPEFERQLENFVYDFLDVDEELIIDVGEDV